MRLTETPEFFNGQCVVSGAGAPLIDTGAECDGIRVYLAPAVVESAVELVGGLGSTKAAALRVLAAEGEIAKRELEECRQELGRLRDSVRTTLAAGAVDTERSPSKSSYKLRTQRGKNAVEV
jgi:hypothetical protein